MGRRGPEPMRREVRWSSELAYAIGLIVTDGSLSVDGRHLDFTSTDKEQIKTLMRCLDLSAQKIAKKKSGLPRHDLAYRVQWGDVVLYRFLLSIGLMPNKTKRLGTLSIPDEYFFDFLRGHYDGDGSFYSYFDPRWKNSFMFYVHFVSASPTHLNWLRGSLRRLLKVNGHITTASNSSVIQLKFAKRETLRILERLYPREGVACLKRKRLKIEHALRIVGKSLPGRQRN